MSLVDIKTARQAAIKTADKYCKRNGQPLRSKEEPAAKKPEQTKHHGPGGPVGTPVVYDDESPSLCETALHVRGPFSAETGKQLFEMMFELIDVKVDPHFSDPLVSWDGRVIGHTHAGSVVTIRLRGMT